MSRNFKTAEVNSMQLMNERAFALFILPIMLSNVFQQLYAPVNAAVISRFRSADDLAVIGACSFTAMLQGFVFGGMSTGFGICLCDCAGETGAFSKGELSRSSKVWTASLVLTGFLTFLGFIAAAAAPLILTFLRVPKELRVMACPYLAVLLAGSGPSTLRGLMIWMLQAKKQTAKSGLISAVSVVTQTALTVLFIGFLHLPVWASSLAAALNHLLISALIFLSLLRDDKTFVEKGTNSFPLSLCPVRSISPEIWSQLLGGGFSKAGMKLLTGLGALPKQLVLNSFPVDRIAGYTVAMTISNIPQVILGAYGTCAAILLGKWYGAQKPDLLRAEAKRLFTHAAVLAVLLTVSIFIFGSPLIRAVAGEGASQELIRSGYQVLAISSAGLAGLAIYCVGHFGLQVIGKYKVQLVFGFISMLTQVAALALTAPRIGFVSLPFTMMMSWIIPGIAAGIASEKALKK